MTLYSIAFEDEEIRSNAERKPRMPIGMEWISDSEWIEEIGSLQKSDGSNYDDPKADVV